MSLWDLAGEIIGLLPGSNYLRTFVIANHLLTEWERERFHQLVPKYEADGCSKKEAEIRAAVDVGWMDGDVEEIVKMHKRMGS